MCPKNRDRVKERPFSSTGGRLFWFAGKLVLFLLLFALVWPFLGPYYNRLVAGTAQLFVPLVPGMPPTLITVGGGDIEVYRRGPELGGREWVATYSQYLFLGLGLLITLFLATPNLKALTRLRRLGLGLGILFAIDVLYILYDIRSTYISGGIIPVSISDAYFDAWLQSFFAIGRKLFPVLIWGLLTFTFWLPRPKATEVMGKGIKEGRKG